MPRSRRRPQPRSRAAAVAPLGPAGRRVQRVLVLVVGGALAVALVTLGVLILVRGSGGGAAEVCPADTTGWNGAGAGALQRGYLPAAVHDPGTSWTPAWTYPSAAAGSRDAVSGPPSEAGGLVFTARDDGTLVALDAGAGTLRWSSPPGRGEAGRALVPVALDGCTAVIATSFADPRDGEPAGAVRAVDLATHQRRWGIAAGDEVVSAPEITNGVAFIGLGFRQGTTLNRDWLVDGLNLLDGSVGFRERFRAAVGAATASDGARLFAAAFDQNLYAFAIDQGPPRLRQIWSFSTGGIITAAPVVGDGTVYLAGDAHLVEALDIGRGGAERWHFDAGVPLDVTPVLAAQTLVVAGREGQVLALDVQSGRLLWRVDTHARISSGQGGLAAAGDRVAVADGSGTVRLLDLRDGSQRGLWTAPAPTRGSPAIAGRMLYVTCADGRLYALPL